MSNTKKYKKPERKHKEPNLEYVKENVNGVTNPDKEKIEEGACCGACCSDESYPDESCGECSCDYNQADEVDDVEKLKKERDEYKNMYAKALADYRNLESKTQEKIIGITTNVHSELISRLLPFLDNLRRAEVFVSDPGLKMIKDNLYKILSELGLEEVPLEGKEFDPKYAEVIEIVEGKKDNIIVEVVLVAYSFKGKVIRHGQVKVSKKNKEK